MAPRPIVLASVLWLGSDASAHAQWPETIDDSKVTVVKHEAVTYPQIARSARLQGAVVVGVSFDGQGTVTDGRALSGPPLLKEAAVTAVRRWTFAPSTQGRAILVVDFEIVETCVDEAPPPPFKLRSPNRAFVYACSMTMQPASGIR